MIRESKFVLTRNQYAVDLGSLCRPVPQERYELAAVWFRRRKNITVACIGVLWDIQNPPPADAAEFLDRVGTGRYGGDCRGRWDGARYWGAQEPEAAAAHLERLRPMLANYPAAPARHDGWWRF